MANRRSGPARLRSVRRRLRPISLILAAGLALTACGDDDDDRGDLNVQTGTGTGAETGTATTETSTEPAGAASETIRVRETEFALDPANPRISSTGVVEFRVANAGKVVHSLEVEGPEGEQETDAIQPGDSATLKVNFNRAGRYEWYCPIGDHRDRGMGGEITVGGGGAGRSEDNTTTSEDEVETESGGDNGGGGSNSGSGGGGSGY
jgi:uncharacterized cupredoxin-like copper-binding protein